MVPGWKVGPLLKDTRSTPPDAGGSVQKYRTCAGRILPPEQVEASMEAILHLKRAGDLRTVMDLLVAAS